MNLNKTILFIALLNSAFLFSQKWIFGKVIDDYQKPIIGAAVYFNNTSLGTSTNYNGEFELFVEEGTHELVVSFVGYKTFNYQINTKTYAQPLLFNLKYKNTILDEVVISTKKKKDPHRKWHLNRFKSSFIGNTELSKSCKIINEDVIIFEYNSKSGSLEAYSKEPIIMIHKGLGYKITYDLVNFELSKDKVTYLGYSRYEQIKGNKRKRARWKKNRQKAYFGSRIHFVRSLRNNRLEKAGFVVKQFKRVPNLQRPHDSIIEKAQKYVQAFNGSFSISNFQEEIVPPLTKKDSAINILRKKRLEKFINVTLKENVLGADLIFKENNIIKMSFDHFLKITYLNEAEEFNYRPFSNSRLNIQSSIIQLYAEDVILDPSGEFINPLDVFFLGYWSYEKFADNLPLNYWPNKG